MRVSYFLFTLAGAGLVSVAAWLVVLFYIDPTETGTTGMLLFYATLACALFTIIVFLGLLSRIALKRMQHQTVVAFRLMLPTIRQALWCSLLVIVSLILAAQELFSLFSGLVFVLFCSFF